MSNALNPWILDFLLTVAKDFGAKLFDIKPHTKKKKVQIIEFLTYPPKDHQNTVIWARISDKKHIATVKFTPHAVSECQARLTGMRRLTQHKGAIATISNFKPISSRFPLEQDRMSSERFIIFECDSVDILGSSGEATFGLPKGIEQDPEISLWSKGIAQGGGAGNVLKERIHSRPFKQIDDDNLETYKAKWHFAEKDRLGYVHERSRSGTPISDWQPSPGAEDVKPTPTPPPKTRLTRKVPRPHSPEPPAPEQTGPGRVLVPNSDTSQSQSQTMAKMSRTEILGGNVVETIGELPWMTMGEVGHIMRITAELRLHN